MSGILCQSYDPSRDPQAAAEWNRFIHASRVPYFLFDRNYMDYHQDRFTDASLLFRAGETLVAVLPANLRNGCLESHGGLTFGGIIASPDVGTALTLEIFAALIAKARSEGWQEILYKRAPFVFHALPGDEDAYALFRHGFELFRRDASTAIDLRLPLHYSKGRKHALGKAGKSGLELVRSEDFEGFHALLTKVLRKRHDLSPVHSVAELKLLASRFPQHILLIGAFKNGVWLSGGVLYFSGTVCHTQYLAADEIGRECGAMDVVVDHAIQIALERRCHYLSFGVSTEDGGMFLNEGLIGYKEMFGGSALCHDFYRLTL